MSSVGFTGHIERHFVLIREDHVELEVGGGLEVGLEPSEDRFREGLLEQSIEILRHACPCTGAVTRLLERVGEASPDRVVDEEHTGLFIPGCIPRDELEFLCQSERT